MSIIFPVIDKDEHRGVYHPLPHIPEDNWQNKNRRERSFEEIDEAMIEEFGSAGVQPCRFGIIGLAYDPKNMTYEKVNGENIHIIDVDDNMIHHWNLFKIIKMGPDCFSSERFQFASATYGDWVNVDPTGVQLFRFKNKVLAWFTDQSVKIHMEDPTEAVNL